MQFSIALVALAVGSVSAYPGFYPTGTAPPVPTGTSPPIVTGTAPPYPTSTGTGLPFAPHGPVEWSWPNVLPRVPLFN